MGSGSFVVTGEVEQPQHKDHGDFPWTVIEARRLPVRELRAIVRPDETVEDGVELTTRAILGQQVSVARARTLATRLVDDLGAPLDLAGDHEVSRVFPTAAALAAIDPKRLAMPRARGRALAAAAAALDDGSVVLDRSADRADVRARLLALAGIGPWTADYVAFRVLGDPDVFLPTDAGVRRAAERLGLDDLEQRSQAWRPWRSYALAHLWSSLGDPDPATPTTKES